MVKLTIPMARTLTPPAACVVAAWVLASMAVACSNPSSPAGPTPAAATGLRLTGETATALVAGDIGLCGSPGVEAAARLVERTPGVLLLAGDLAYMHGTASDFRRCFDPFWGRFRDRWHAVPGNHEYETAGASPFFDYFGDAAGRDRTGYYAIRVGDWLVLMLNSSAPAQRHTPQWEFVRQTLGAQPLPCTMAVWHHPLFTSGPNGANPFMHDIWALLETAGAELVVNGHDHLYERFGPQTADGQRTEQGIRQLTAGTGGAELYRSVGATPHSEVRITEFGVIRLFLQPAGYRWEFLTTAGGIADSGTDSCH